MSFSSSHRSDQLEIMDDLQCSGEVVHQTLRELDFINRWLGGNDVTRNALKKVLLSRQQSEKLTIVDLGCGSGEMLKLILKDAEKAGRDVELIGIDANPHIIEFASIHCKGISQISFRAIDIFSEEFKKMDFDIVVATLFTHHFNKQDLAKLFDQLKKKARVAIVVNDLHRHVLAYHSIRLLTKFFSKSAMVKYDAPLSVARAFQKKDWIEILSKAGIMDFRLKWKWAFRWQLIIPTNPG